jgi:hypothetical protein
MMTLAPILSLIAVGQGAPAGSVPIDIGKPVALSLHSKPVEYHGNKLSIVSVSGFTAHFGGLTLVPKPALPTLDLSPPTGSIWQVTPVASDDPFPFLAIVESRLKAVLRAHVAQYSNVDYRLHGAVYDAKGRLLGTASAVERVQYIRVGQMPSLLREIELDFGVSERYRDAAKIAFAISEPAVPKPPDGG